MDIIAELSKTLGSFRAENLGDRMFSFYTKPTYFPELLTPIPCMLQGGRGTGKTTVLKCLSYEGQFRLANENFSEFNKQNYIGLYYKLETGLVSAFAGANKEEKFWQNLFSHFINLQLCKQLCDFAIWFEQQLEATLTLDTHKLKAFCKSIGVADETSFITMGQALDLSIADIEANVNFASDADNIKFTAIGAPTRRLVKLLRDIPELSTKTFYFLFDEYENLQGYQQATLNTFIKQADVELSFKIGIRQLGLKTRHTLNPNEQLVDPADYVLIDISQRLKENEFAEFAQNVLEHRFEELRNMGISLPTNVPEIFQDLTEEEEAIKLGAKDIALNVIEAIKRKATAKELEELKLLNTRELALIEFFCLGSKNGVTDVYEMFKKIISDPKSWTNQINNYGYAALFSIRKRKVGISKYYSGWNTLLSLAAGNIRYLLQLVNNSLIAHAKDYTNPEAFVNQKVSAKCQTEVAAEVGKKNLLELEGLSTRGAQLMKLVLGMGQILHEMAIQPEGHAPEITQFEVSDKLDPNNEEMQQVNELLRVAVMHLALLRPSGTKLGSQGDTRDFDYMLHPIFAPFFVYSHRRKRKFLITPQEFLGIISEPSVTIKKLLKNHNRSVSDKLPEQLRLFGGFYERNS